MVGVPGKYRGCETCRSRRVKCGNEKPLCKRCVDSNRECTYERETVFIVASIEDGGRCSSHPPRKTAKKGKTVTSKPPEEEKLELVPEEPLVSAWNDLISVSNVDRKCTLQLAALHTNLHSILRGTSEDGSDDGNAKSAPISFAPYEIPNVQPILSEDDFQVRSKALVHLSPPESPPRNEGLQIDGILLFLYEHNNSIISSLAPWRDPNHIRRQGPDTFRSFPNHHFFVRVYRHNAISAALLNRKPSFLAEPPWMTSPWELHPKSNFDRLLDTIVLLPGLLARADRIVPQDQTLARRLMAQDLLSNCIGIENQFNQWYDTVRIPGQADVMWIQAPEGTDAQIPFADTFAFSDGLTAVTFIYYWMAQLIFYPYVERLYWTIFEPVVDGPFPQTMPVLPGNLQINPLKYSLKEVRDLATNICRSLDFALANTAQPDLLAVPLFVVCQFFQHVGLDHGAVDDEVFGDGRLELMWCDAFRGRVVAKGSEMQEVAQSKQWRDLAAF